MLRAYMKNFKGKTSKKAQRGVCNCLQMIKSARNGDMSGEDLSDLDLRLVSLNGVRFSTYNSHAIFDGSYISESTFFTFGHSKKVTSAVYSPDEKYVLTVSEDGTVKEWDRQTGLCLNTFNGYVGIYNPTKNRILIASYDGGVREWDKQTGQYLQSFGNSERTVTNVVYSPGGERILIWIKVGYENFMVEEWCIETNECLSKRECLGLYDIAYHPLKQQILLLLDKVVEIRDIETWECLRIFRCGMAFRATYKPDGKRILLDTCEEFDAESGESIRIYVNPYYRNSTINNALEIQVMYSSDGLHAYTANSNGIDVWDSETGAHLHTTKDNSETSVHLRYMDISISARTFNKKGTQVLAAYSDGTVKEWDVYSGKCLSIFHTKALQANCAVYDTEEKSIIAVYSDKTVKEWDRMTRQCTQIYNGHTGAVKYAVGSLDGLTILSSDTDTTVRLWDRETGKCLQTFSWYLLNLWLWKDKSSADRQRRLCEAGVDYSKLDARLDHGKYIENYYELDRESIGDIKEAVKESGGKEKELMRFHGHSDEVNSMIYSSDESHILSASDDGTIKEWVRETGECIWTSPPYGGINIVGCSFYGCEFPRDEVKELIKIFGGKI